MGTRIRTMLSPELKEETIKAYARRQQRLDDLTSKIKARKKAGKSTNNLDREYRIVKQSDPTLIVQYGRKTGIGMTARAQKKVRHEPGVADVLKRPEGSVWHHIIETQTGQDLFKGNLSVDELIELNETIAIKGMVLGESLGSVMDLPERLHKGGKSTTNAAQDIHNWVTVNTPKNASWTRLTAASSMKDRLAAVEDMAEFFHKSKRQIQKLQFSQYQIGGIQDAILDIDAPGQATKASLEGGKVKPGWPGNFADMVENPVIPARVRAYNIEHARLTGNTAERRRLQALPPAYGGPTKVAKATSGLRKSEALARLATSAATGDLVGGTVAAGQIAMGEALQNPTVAKAVMRQTKAMGSTLTKRFGKTGLKMIPGLDIALSAMEAGHYLKQGKLDQAGIAALSGAIGWIPVIGDAAAAGLDLTNTAFDIARLNIQQQPDAERRYGDRMAADYAEDVRLERLTSGPAPQRIRPLPGPQRVGTIRRITGAF